jgi:hypothetical protein
MEAMPKSAMMKAAPVALVKSLQFSRRMAQSERVQQECCKEKKTWLASRHAKSRDAC